MFGGSSPDGSRGMVSVCLIREATSRNNGLYCDLLIALRDPVIQYNIKSYPIANYQLSGIPDMRRGTVCRVADSSCQGDTGHIVVNLNPH